jgi:hypothetical protein
MVVVFYRLSASCWGIVPIDLSLHLHYMFVYILLQNTPHNGLRLKLMLRSNVTCVTLRRVSESCKRSFMLN